MFKAHGEGEYTHEVPSPVGEDDCTQLVNDEDSIDRVLNFEAENDYSDNEEVISSPSHEKQLAAIALCKRLCDPNDIRSVVFRELGKLQIKIRFDHSKKSKQLKIDHFYIMLYYCN